MSSERVDKPTDKDVHLDNDEADQIGIEDIFGADGLDDEFSDLEGLPDSDDEEKQKKSTTSGVAQAGASSQKTESAKPIYEFTLPRFKKRDRSAVANNANEYQQEDNDNYQITESNSPRDESTSRNHADREGAKESVEGKSKTSAAKEFMDSVMKDVKGTSSRSKRRRKNGDLDEVTRMDDEASALKRAMHKQHLMTWIVMLMNNQDLLN
ncbi:hypothetical protein BDF22DRAFT_744995 [Syncephalis plumigaleata]|nr:hypothetical protein BDF22DRAFT_744995 [Syncephalis plumigaleata]